MVQDAKRKTRRKKYNSVAIKEAADPLMVAREIRMNLQENQGSKVSVLCPGHDDQHHGSCFITEKGCHCYSGECNRTYDVFDMVMLHCNMNFKDAAGLIADLCGGRERFLIEDNGSEDADSTMQGNLKMISRPEMELIGVYSTPMYVTREVVPSFCEPERQSGIRHVWYPGDPDKDEDDYVVIEEMVVKNPLLELLRSDPEAYAELIQNKAWEKWERYRHIQQCMARYSRQIAREITPKIRYIEEIIIEYGGSLRCPPNFIDERIA